jgi:hypothetical protein
MPLSTLYKVVTRYETDSRSAEAKVDRLTRKAEKNAKAIERARGQWAMFGTALKGLAIGGLTLGLGLITKRMFSLTQAAEDAQIQIAAVFEQSNPGKFEKNLSRAGDLFKRFQKSSITSPATSADFLTLFGGVAPGVAPLGVSNAQIDKFVSRAVPAAKAFTGGDFEQAGRDLLQMLQGQAGSDTKTFNSLKADLFKRTKTKDTESFNKLAKKDPRKIFDAINATLSGMDAVNAKFGASFGGLLASVQEFADGFLRTIGGPVVKTAGKILQRMVGWFQDNAEAVEAMGVSIGEKFASGLLVAEKLSKMILNNFQGIAIVGAAIGAKKLFGLGSLVSGAVGGGAKAALGANLGAASRIGIGAGRGLLRAPGRLAGAAVSGVGELMFGGMMGPRQDRFSKGFRGLKAAGTRQIMGQGINFQSLNKGAGALKAGAMGAISGGIPALAGAFSTLATILLPLVVVVGMIAGTFRVLKDGANEATKFFRNSVDELMIALDTIAIQFGSSGGFASGLMSIVDWLGTGVVGILGIGVKVVERLANAFTYMFAVFKGAFLGIGSMINRIQSEGFMAAFDPSFVKKAFSEGMAKSMAERAAAEKKAFRALEKKKKEKKAAEEIAATTAGGKPKPKINVTINQQIKTDANPDRIAFRVGEVIGDTMRKYPRATAGLATR